MASDIFLKLDGIQGEATADGHANELVVESFQWGLHNPHQQGAGAGSGAGKVEISAFTVMKYSDKSSAQLFQACCAGKHFKEAHFTARKAAGTKALDYMKYTFEGLFVTDFQWGGSKGDNTPMEHVSFSFDTVKISYTPQNQDGSAASPVRAGWDLKHAKAL